MMILKTSRLTWLGLGAFVIALLFAPVYSARGIGHRNLIIHFEGELAAETQIRIATMLQRHAVHYLTYHPHPEVMWRSIGKDETEVEIQVSHGVNSTSSLFFHYGTKRYPYQDTLAVEYRRADEPPRFRVVSFKDFSKADPIELTIPREPPSDAEAWQAESAASKRSAAGP